MDPLMLDFPAPGFSLPRIGGGATNLQDFLGRVVALNFWSAECPHSARCDAALAAARQAWGDAVVVLNIAANANETLEQLQSAAAARGVAVLHDAGHLVADLYGAQTTPHLFVIDREGILRYQGAFDDMTFRQRTPTRSYLVDAVNAVLRGEQPDPAQTPAYGCAIVRLA